MIRERLFMLVVTNMQKISITNQVNKMYKYRSVLLIIFLLSTLIFSILMKQSQGKPNNISNHLVEERIPTGLYDQEDDVIILDINNFNDHVYNAKRAWLVEFYNSWCGHCIKFAPTWKEFAKSIKGWRNIIAVGAVDCADEDNTQLCREYEIMGYPTLRYFSVNSSIVERGDRFTYVHSVPELRENIVQTLASDEVLGKYGNWPSLKTNVNATDLKDIWKSFTSKEEFIVAVLDSGISNLAGQLVLDLSVNLGVTAARVRKDNIINRDENSDIYIVYRNLTVIPLNQTVISREHYNEIFKLLKKKWGTGEQSEKIGNISSVFKTIKLPLDPKIMANKVFQIDLETVIRYSLYHEISIQPLITGDALRLLIKFLNVLEKYYPVGMNIPMFIGKVKYEILTKNNLTGMEFKNILQIIEIENENFPIFNMDYEWLGCKGSIENRRGYPCGLWILFHSLTVSAASKGHLSSTNDEVLSSMAGYIKYFFGCKACAEHFQQMATTIGTNVTSLDRSILWLWNAHNMVNRRLAGDESEDPSFPKIQFPSRDMCPECRYDDGRWDEANVLRYLKNIYSKIQHTVPSRNKNAISSEWKGYKSINEDTSDWDVGDVTAIIIFYILSIAAFVIYAYRFFIRRLPRPKYYNHDIVFPA